jgi:hypothetical protein
LKLNAMQQLLVYVLIGSSKEVGLEVNTEKTNLMCLHQNPVQQQQIKTVNRCLENVTKFKYENLGTTVINRNLILEKMERSLYWRSACCYSVRNLISSHLLFKNIKIKLYKIIILPLIL